MNTAEPGECNRYMATGWSAAGSEFESQWGQDSFPHHLGRSRGPIELPSQLLGAAFLGDKVNGA
jgi:hypothetical protein